MYRKILFEYIQSGIRVNTITEIINISQILKIFFILKEELSFLMRKKDQARIIKYFDIERTEKRKMSNQLKSMRKDQRA